MDGGRRGELHHGKPVYRCAEPRSVSSVIYYWDCRDGPCVRGWWIATDVNCADGERWACSSDALAAPPEKTWKVPYDGQVDQVLRVLPDVVDILQQPQASDGVIWVSKMPVSLRTGIDTETEIEVEPATHCETGVPARMQRLMFSGAQL